MALLFIRVLPDTPFSQRRIELDGADYLLTLEWNMRSGWYCGLSLHDGTPVFAPRKLLHDVDLLETVTGPGRPGGKLVLADLSGRGERPTYSSLGEQHQLCYLTSDDAA